MTEPFDGTILIIVIVGLIVWTNECAEEWRQARQSDVNSRPASQPESKRQSESEWQQFRQQGRERISQCRARQEREEMAHIYAMYGSEAEFNKAMNRRVVL